MNKKLTVVMSGVATQDLLDALQEVQSMVSDGYTTGFNMNETSRFNFEVIEDDQAADQ